MRSKKVEADLVSFPLSLVIYPEHPSWACQRDLLIQAFVLHLKDMAGLYLCLFEDCLDIGINAQRTSIKNAENPGCIPKTLSVQERNMEGATAESQ